MLPGRPGLDLVIGRQYNSEDAMITYPWVSGYTYVDHYYYVFYRVYTVVFVNDGDAVPISETYRYGSEGPFTDKDTALACANHFSGLVIADEDPETGMLTMDLL